MPYTFILSDESVNSYGFRVLTDGIRMERFEKNPVMLYMHETGNEVIGRWENLRKEGDKLLADAVFDESGELGLKIKTKVDNNFLRAVSIGLQPVGCEVIAGIDAVTDCELIEASIVAIPSNQNAVRLYNKKGEIVLSLSALQDGMDVFRPAILELLQLPAITPDSGILDAIRELQQKTPTPDKRVNHALKMGLIDKSQLILLKRLAKQDGRAFGEYIKEREQSLSVEVDKVLRVAVQKGQILSYDRAIFKEIGQELGLKTLENVLSVFPQKVSLMAILEDKTLLDRSQWGLNEYRKFAPYELRDNPDLYTELTERDRGRKELAAGSAPEPVPGRNLDHYRKHNPGYLADNPDEYKRLLKQKNTKNKK